MRPSRYRCRAVSPPGEARSRQGGCWKYATEGDLRILITPRRNRRRKLMKQSVRGIKIEDLLGRPEIKISMDEIVSNFRGQDGCW